MKKIIFILIIALLFTGCEKEVPEEKITEYYYSGVESGIFPFYVIGEDDGLWCVKKNRAYSLGYTVNYNVGGREESFVKCVDGAVFFATDITVKNGIKLCDVVTCEEEKEPQLILENIMLESLRVTDSGDILYIDQADTLFFRRDGINIKIEENVSEAELVGEDTFLFRMKNGTLTDGELLYPIYYATAEYRNHLIDALDIVAADMENGKAYIIKDRHTVQKRATIQEVAHCYVYSEGEIIFDIPSVLLSQFNENKHVFLIACNENEPTLKYNLYRIDGSSPVLKASGIASGKYISADRQVFAYETTVKGEIRTEIINPNDKIASCVLGEKYSLDSLKCINEHIYIMTSGTLGILNYDSAVEEIGTNISKAEEIFGRLFCFMDKTPPYSVMVCEGKEMIPLVSDAANKNFIYENGYFYYFSGETKELSLVDSGGKKTALMSSADTEIGFLAKNGTVAAVRSEDKSLYILSQNGITDTKLKVKRFI